MTSTEDTAPQTSGLRWCSAAIAAATLVLALGNADSVRNWADGLRPSPWSQPVRDAAERWASFTTATRLSLARDEVRWTWEHRHDLGWSGLARKRPDLAAAT